MPKAGETGGLYFATALQHVFVGLYIEEICLIGLFFLAQDVNGHPSALPEGICSSSSLLAKLTLRSDGHPARDHYSLPRDDERSVCADYPQLAHLPGRVDRQDPRSHER